jgi:AcrR family transcriptional regulator
MLAEDDGWQFTLRELARRAGVSHTAAYKHFADKGALLSELALLGFEQLRAALLAARPARPKSPRDEFLTMSRAYVKFGAAHPNLYQLMFSADARAADNARLTERGAAALDVLLELIIRGQSDGWIRKRNPRAQAGAVWAQLHGLALLTIDALLTREKVGPNAADAALEVLLEGLEVGAVGKS